MSGDFPGKVFEILPANSDLILIGNLTHSDLVVKTSNVLFSGKVIRPYLLLHELVKMTQEHKDRHFKIVSDDLRDGGKIFGSKIVQEITLDNYEEGFKLQN